MNLTMRAKNGAKRVLKWTAARVGGAHEAPRILTYHSVGDRDHPMNVSPKDFDRQMAWLSDNQNVQNVETIIGGENGVAISFDDGYRDNFTNVFPVMAKRGLPWTVFVVTGRLGGWLDHDAAVDAARLMSEDELLELVGHGVSVGGHTQTHARLSSLPVDAQRQEIFDCFASLCEFGVEAPGFAYPFGSSLDFDQTSMRLVEEAGFAYALSNRYGSVVPESVPWCVERIWIDRTDTFETFQQKVSGELDGLRWLDSRAGIGLRRVVNNFIGRAGGPGS